MYQLLCHANILSLFGSVRFFCVWFNSIRCFRVWFFSIYIWYFCWASFIGRLNFSGYPRFFLNNKSHMFVIDTGISLGIVVAILKCFLVNSAKYLYRLCNFFTSSSSMPIHIVQKLKFPLLAC